ncbi:MAG: PDZ domain-containing protein [Deltaproteobacteria bacterium]|nr:PDZ domain-containing protein [Deltaproteobacteria bacterium]
MTKKEPTPFCKKELRPLLGLLVAVFLLTMGWVTYHEIKMKRDPVYAAEYRAAIHPSATAKNAAIPVAGGGMPPPMVMQGQLAAAKGGGGIPPIKLSDVMTHPNYGQDCTKCHEVIGPKSRAPINGGSIPVTATMTHPYWGPCAVCHQVLDAQGTPVALTVADAQSILGLELTEATTAMTLKLDLPDKKGAVITRVLPGGLAANLGMENGDMFYMVDTRKVETIAELERALGTFAAGDTVRVNVWRQQREKIFRFSMPDIAAQVALGTQGPQGTAPQGNPIAFAQADPKTAVIEEGRTASVIAVASTGKNVNDALSNELTSSPYFIVVDLKKNTFKVVQNKGGTGLQVAQDLMDLGAEAVICGAIGQGAATGLTNLGITLYPGVNGDVRGAIDAFKQGSLKAVGAPATPNDVPIGPGFSGRRKTL